MLAAGLRKRRRPERGDGRAGRRDPAQRHRDRRHQRQGGGGGVNCRNRPIFGGGPAFSTFEDNQVTGDLIVGGLNSCWLGVIRNTVQGTIAVYNNKMADPDANEITDNHVHGSLTCFGNSPAAQVGDSEGGKNVVTGTKAFECSSL